MKAPTIAGKVLVGFDTVDQLTTSDEATAVAWAQERATKMVSQVTLIASTDDLHTFAIRHITHDRDSGWRGWQAGAFVGPVELDQLQESAA